MAEGGVHQRYKDKVTIVTGGSKGIGEGCVRVFGKIYFDVYIVSILVSGTPYKVCISRLS